MHHIELWVPDLRAAAPQWRWLLGTLGYVPFQDWTTGRSWRLGDTYLVIEQSPALIVGEHDRQRPGLNHLAFHAGDRATVDALAAAGPDHGWTLMFGDTHPYAGGKDHYAAHLTNTDGYEVDSSPATHDQLRGDPQGNNCSSRNCPNFARICRCDERLRSAR